MRWSRFLFRVGISLALAFCLTRSSEAQESTVDICTESVSTINHPAQYVRRMIKKCRSVFLTPHCCGPTWRTHPECYVLRRRRISSAWQEIVHKKECDTQSLEVGFKEFMSRRLDPRLQLPEAKTFMAFIEVMVAAQMGDGKPLPNRVTRKLYRYLEQYDLHFAKQDVGNARYVGYGLNPLSPKSYGQSQDTMTWGNLIVAGPGLLSAKGCLELATWAHELVHVRQYRDMGFYTFQTAYLSDRAAYKDKAAEREAYKIEAEVVRICEEELPSQG
jgi:hypothetical protein